MAEQFPPRSSQPHDSRRQFLIGLGVGRIPLIVFMVGLGGCYNPALGGPGFFVNLFGVSALAYVAEIAAMAILLAIDRTRQIGYGVVVALAVDPVVAFIGCSVLTPPR